MSLRACLGCMDEVHQQYIRTIHMPLNFQSYHAIDPIALVNEPAGHQK